MSPVLLNPTGRSDEAMVPLATAPIQRLDGKTVGLLHSTKFNSDRVLDAVAELLEQRWAVKKVVRARKPTFAGRCPRSSPRRWPKQCDVVITGVGD